MDINNITITGRVFSVEEKLRNDTSALYRVTITTDVPGGKNPATGYPDNFFLNVDYWIQGFDGQPAKISDAIARGNKIGVEGRLCCESFTKADGSTGKSWYVKAKKIVTLNWVTQKEDSENPLPAAPATMQAKSVDPVF